MNTIGWNLIKNERELDVGLNDRQLGSAGAVKWASRRHLREPHLTARPSAAMSDLKDPKIVHEDDDSDEDDVDYIPGQGEGMY